MIEIAARLPWWLALALAVSSYLLLHHWAISTEPPPKDVAQLGDYAGRQLYRSIAMFLQYLVPGVLVIGAVVSVISTAVRKKRFEDTRSLGTRGAFLDMTWQQFESLVGEHFRQQGFAVRQIGGDGPDGGVDLELSEGSERFLVQCKQWRAHKVGVEVVRQLYGVMAARGAAGGYVVTSGQFTTEAQAFASGRNISLLDGERLISAMSGIPRRAEIPLPTISVASPASAPSCPKCKSTMVKRVAKQGARAGQAFWGCSQYPQCTGTRPV